VETPVTGIPVEIAQIERRLRSLWQEGGDALGRACLFNLIVWSENDADTDRVTPIIAELTLRHPCRAIVLLAEPDRAGTSLTAALNAHSHLAAGSRQQVCCEQISLRAVGAAVAQLSSTVLSLLEGDLPTVLWWRGNFLDHPDHFERLQSVAQRIIFDSATGRDPHRRLPQLAERLRRPTTQVYADLSWTRLMQWRRLMADCFDNEQFRPLLPQLRNAVITHGHRHGARLRALLYAGWLATQLRWPPEEATEQVLVRECSGGAAVDMGIESVEISGGGSHLRLQRDCGENAAMAVVTTQEFCSLPRKQALQRPSETALVSQELHHVVPHATYERAVAMAALLEETSNTP
jgi:glucose-6-phosphate dehydrogenase assembly protein OpcA